MPRQIEVSQMPNELLEARRLKLLVPCTFSPAMINIATELNITVTGASLLDAVILGITNASYAKGLFSARVSAANTVTITWLNNTPIAQTGFTENFTIIVLK